MDLAVLQQFFLADVAARLDLWPEGVHHTAVALA